MRGNKERKTLTQSYSRKDSRRMNYNVKAFKTTQEHNKNMDCLTRRLCLARIVASKVFQVWQSINQASKQGLKTHKETQRRLKGKQEKEEGRARTETLPRHRPTTFMKKRNGKADRKTQKMDSHTQTVLVAWKLRAKFELTKGVRRWQN